MRTLPRGVVLAAGAAAMLASGAQAHRIVTYNILNYSSGRTSEFQTVISEMQPEIILVQEILSSSAVTAFRTGVLEVIEPGLWSAGFFHNGPDTDNAIFFRNDRYTYVSHVRIPTSLRDIDEWTLRPAGYASGSANIRFYVVHLKASQGFEAQRLGEVTTLRNRMESFSIGGNYMVLGDFNIYTSAEPAFAYMLNPGNGLAGVVEDPLAAPGNWHNTPSFAWLHTQSPRTSSFGGGSNGGLDDRFDMILTAPSLLDGEGMDYIPGTYTAFGNDGAHFNDAITDPPSHPTLPAGVIQDLHDGSDHLPVFADFELPARVPAGLVTYHDYGLVIAGATAEMGLTIDNDAPLPADELDYSMETEAGFIAPTEDFELPAGAGPAVHDVSLDTSTPGIYNGSLFLYTDAPDFPLHEVELEGIVLGHARPSTDAASEMTTGVIDFGTHDVGEFVDLDATVHNHACCWLQANVEVYDAQITGDARFSIEGGFLPATIGFDPASWTLHFDDAGATEGTYTATLTFSTRDQQDLEGAINLADLTFDLVATVDGLLAGGGTATRPIIPGFGAITPNPFHPATSIEFGLSRGGEVRLSVYDVAGRLVRTLVEGNRAPGNHVARWDGRDDGGRSVGAGIYYLRLITPVHRQTERVVRAK